MIIKKSGGKIIGAQLTVAEKKAMDIEIKKQIAENDRQHFDDVDACILYTLMQCYGFKKDRLRKFYDAFQVERNKLVERYEMPDEYPYLCKEQLKRIGVDIEAWNAEKRTN